MQLIECAKAHYEVQDLEMGKVYRWCPESVAIDCNCGEELILTASRTTCLQCGEDHAAFVAEVLDDVRPVDKEVDHPWRLVRPYYRPTRGT